MVTVDGFFAGKNGEIDWHVVDAEFNEYAIEMLHSVDTLIFGRVTYDMMKSYWSTTQATTDDSIVAGLMNSTSKIVFSKTDGTFDWNNSMVMKDIVADEIIKLKQQPGKDMVILGSGTIVSAFAQLGLIDEYRLIVNPVVLGAGKTLFEGISERLKLKLLKTKTLGSGDVILYYGNN
jgi:dihydrofolate reductase